MDEPIPTLCTVICHTIDCPLAEQARTINLCPNPEPPIWRAECAQCEEPITDIQPVS